MTFQIIYYGTYAQIHPKIDLPIYLHASLSFSHKDLPVTTTIWVHSHTYTRSWPYLSMFILSFRSTDKIYPSKFLLFYMSTDVPVHQYTCAQLPFNSSASLPSNYKHIPVTTTTCVYGHTCARSWPYLFIFMLSFRLTRQRFYCSTYTQMHLFVSILFSLFLPFWHNIHSYLSTHLLGYVRTDLPDLSTHLLGYVSTDLPENKFTRLSSFFSFV